MLNGRLVTRQGRHQVAFFLLVHPFFFFRNSFSVRKTPPSSLFYSRSICLDGCRIAGPQVLCVSQLGERRTGFLLLSQSFSLRRTGEKRKFQSFVWGQRDGQGRRPLFPAVGHIISAFIIALCVQPAGN